jgi:predicted PilT family ATPase
VTGPTEIMLTVPDREAGRIIGKWWSNIETLQKAMWLHIKLKTFEERKKELWWNPSVSEWWVDHQFNVFTKARKTVGEIDLWPTHSFTNVLVRIWTRTYPFQTDEYWVITLSKRKLINEMEWWRYELEIVT